MQAAESRCRENPTVPVASGGARHEAHGTRGRDEVGTAPTEAVEGGDEVLAEELAVLEKAGPFRRLKDGWEGPASRVQVVLWKGGRPGVPQARWRILCE
jgi:hypothetical protein